MAEGTIRIGTTQADTAVQLPLTAVTETFAILAKRGAGKTNTAVVLTEEMVAAGEQVIVVDPVGVWWGLRATADGGPSDLPVVIIGGDHADIPLREGDGRALARLLVETRQSAVLDLSELSKSASRRLMADFLEDLYTVCRQPLHLIVDEADLLAPQRLPKDMTRLAGAMDDVTRRGRAHGIGVTLISQRPAVLSKDVLGQAEVLVALRMTNPRDVAAIDEWVRLHAEDERAREVKASLPSLPIGTAWVWSPGWLEILERVQVRHRRTFDSSATPVPGQQRRSATIAHVDVDALRSRLADLAGTSDKATAKTTTTRPDAQERELRAQLEQRDVELARMQRENERLRNANVGLQDAATSALASLRQALAALEMPPTHRPQSDGPAEGDEPVEGNEPLSAPKEPAKPAPVAAVPQHRTPTPREQVRLRSGATRMLAVLAQHAPRRLTRSQLATLAKMRATGGTFGTYLSDLRRAGLIAESEGLLEITPAGRDHIGADPAEAPQTAAAVRTQWRQSLRAGAGRMFDLVIDAYPGGITRADLAAASGIELSGGTFGTYLSDLRRNGLISEDRGTITAAEILFLEPS